MITSSHPLFISESSLINQSDLKTDYKRLSVEFFLSNSNSCILCNQPPSYSGIQRPHRSMVAEPQQQPPKPLTPPYLTLEDRPGSPNYESPNY